MKYSFYLKYLLLIFCFSSSVVSAGVYIELSPGLAKIDTDSADTRPQLIDFRTGYKVQQHQFELAIMSSLNEDTLNQLTVDIPSVLSVFYRYLPYKEDGVNIHLILGASQIDVDSSYPGIADTTDTFEGISYGVGFEESFTSAPSLKLKLDWIRLYRGEDLNIDALSFGVRYEF